MKLYGRVEDPRTLAVRAIANLAAGTHGNASEDIGDGSGNVEFVAVENEIRKGVTFTGKLPVLHEDQGVVAFSASACATLIASRGSRTLGLLGGDDSFCNSEVSQWIAFSGDIEILSNVAASFGDKLGISGADCETVKCNATKELVDKLGLVERHLDTRTYLVGKSITLADIFLCCALVAPMSCVLSEDTRTSVLVNLTRWFKTVFEQSALNNVLAKSFTFLGESVREAQKESEDSPDSVDLGAVGEVEICTTTATSSAQVSVATLFKRNRMRVKDLLYTPGKGEEYVGKKIKVCGWARTIRSGKKGKLAFIELSDGSCYENLQIVAEEGVTRGFAELMSSGGTDSSHCFIGTVVASPAAGQAVEVVANEAKVLGTINQNIYPLKKTGKGSSGHSMEFLRENAHLRARTNLIGAVARVRNACAQAVHEFFREREFLYVHTPILTGADCEGAGEMFQVTTLLSQIENEGKELPLVKSEGDSAKSQGVDFRQDFFGAPVYLTVSGQLNVETYACALSDVYTFGPTFRAENSHTSRHLAEFWMIEPELCFAEFVDIMNLAEDFLKYIAQYVLTHCPSDIDFFDERVEKGLRERLRNVIDSPFQRLTYTEAIDLLNQPEHLEAAKFEEHPSWGVDLGSEHERYLAEKVYKKPVILTDYPADIKAFYMKQNELDSEKRLTVQAMDILVPRIGEVIGGSAREDNLERLETRIVDMGMHPRDFSWYLDLRRFGTVPHGGFGMGFERLVMFVSGVTNIRDVIPFPRYPKNCAF